MVQLKMLAARIIAEEFQAGLEIGLIPLETDEMEIKSLYDFNVDLLYEIVCGDPQLKILLCESDRQNKKITLQDLFSSCPA